MFAKEPPEGWKLAECQEQWLRRLREESPAAPADQAAAPSQTGHSNAADQAAAPSQAGHTNFIAAAPWEHAGAPSQAESTQATPCSQAVRGHGAGLAASS